MILGSTLVRSAEAPSLHARIEGGDADRAQSRPVRLETGHQLALVGVGRKAKPLRIRCARCLLRRRDLVFVSVRADACSSTYAAKSQQTGDETGHDQLPFLATPRMERQPRALVPDASCLPDCCGSYTVGLSSNRFSWEASAPETNSAWHPPSRLIDQLPL